jgi:large subunit ribosomal protein L17
MFRNMATSLLDKSRIETTEIKAKELRHYVEKMITLGKRGDLHARRQALSFLRSKDVVSKVFGEYAERFKDRPGGYTRIMKVGSRAGDNARMAIIELLGEKEPAEKEKTKKPAAEGSKREEAGKVKAAPKGEKKTEKITAKTEKPKKPAKKSDTGDEKPPKKVKKGSAEE